MDEGNIYDKLIFSDETKIPLSHLSSTQNKILVYVW